MNATQYSSLLDFHFELDSLLDQGLISGQPLAECLCAIMKAASQTLGVPHWVMAYEDHFCRPVVLSSQGDGWEAAQTLLAGSSLAEFMTRPRQPLAEPLEVAGCRLGTLALLGASPDPFLELGLRQLTSRLDTHLYQHNAWSFEALKARGVQVLDGIFDSSHKLKDKLQESLAWLVDALGFRGGFLLVPAEGQLQMTASSVRKPPRGDQQTLLEAATLLWDDRVNASRLTRLEIGPDHFLAIVLQPEPRPAEGLLLLYDPQPVSEPRAQLADFFAHLLDSALQSNRLYSRSLAGFLEALGSVIDTFDPYTHGHSQRVASYALALGAELHLTQAELDLLWVAAILHDIGKVGVATEILRKQGLLDATQLYQVREHAAFTERILKGMSVDDFEELSFIASSHHEREDGSGYPRGLRAREIPHLTKILAVVDVFDAVTSDRPQHPGRTRDQGYQILRDEVEAGRLHDVVVSRFLQPSVWERIRPEFQRLKLEAALESLERDASEEPLEWLGQARAALLARNAAGEDFCATGVEEKLRTLAERITDVDWSALREL